MQKENNTYIITPTLFFLGLSFLAEGINRGALIFLGILWFISQKLFLIKLNRSKK